MRRIFFFVTVFCLIAHISWAGRAQIDTVSRDPYVSALVVDADSGETLFEDNVDAVIYPASVLKLMVLLIILERIEANTLNLDEMVQVTKEASRMGGSQVYLDPKEQFTVDELLYALMIQSANDAAVALAMHVSGSKQGFVSLMNQRAAELGMKNTQFFSVHGLPPSEGQKADQSTAVDLSVLSRELARKQETFRYTGTRERAFRNGEFMMRTHNHLLKSIDGCDGFKTGYFKAAGFSIVATAKRNGVRIIALVLGSTDRKVRDAKASELLAKGFAKVPPKLKETVVKSKAETVIAPVEAKTDPPVKQEREPALMTTNAVVIFGAGFASGVILCVLLAVFRTGNRSRKHRRFS